MDLRFRDRSAAGSALAEALLSYSDLQPIVIGHVRGGVPVAREVAATLHAEFGLLAALRLHVPGEPERAAGAVAPGVHFFDDRVVNELEISDNYLEITAQALDRELARRIELFGGCPDVSGRDVILVDDGIATGATAGAGIRSLRRAGAHVIVLAVPVATRSGLEVARGADETVVLSVLAEGEYVSSAFENFRQLTDDDVLRQIALAGAGH
jgi:putative phosphoribosyl transferase